MEDRLIALNRFFRERNMKAQDIAEKVGMSRMHINNLLSGKSKFIMKTACLFSDVFGLSPAWLLTGEGEMLGTADTGLNGGGNRFNQFLVDKDISKAEAARRVGIAPNAISNIISGHRQLSVNLSERISSALGVSASWLLTGEGEMEVDGWTPPARVPQTAATTTTSTTEENTRLHRENSELRAEVERLRKQVERLMSVVENLTRGKEEA